MSGYDNVWKVNASLGINDQLKASPSSVIDRGCLKAP